MKDLDFIDRLLPEINVRVKKMKNDILMEEPCPIYEADEKDWEDFWYNEDK
jgi:hypothetical protein